MLTHVIIFILFIFANTVRSIVPDITALGVAMAAGHAKGIEVWDLEGEEVETVPTDTFLPTTTPEGNIFFSNYKIVFVSC